MPTSCAAAPSVSWCSPKAASPATGRRRKCCHRIDSHRMNTFNVDTTARYIELDTDRRIRLRNKLHYRFNHWPIWIFVFFIAPGPWTFDVIENGLSGAMGLWLALVLIGT